MQRMIGYVSEILMKSPRSVDLDITAFCNLHCAYCSHFTGPGDVGADLPLEAWLAFFAELGQCAVMNVTLSGGEPFFRPDLRSLLTGIISNRMRFSILTNGTLIDDNMALYLASTGRCNMIQVSIDGAVDVTHDTFRGKGNFALAVRGIKTLQRHKLPISVRVTIHRKNVHELEAIAGLLLEDIGLPSFSTNAAGHMGLCRKNAEQTQLTAVEHTLAMEVLLDLADRYPGRISASAGPLADARAWREMETARKENHFPPSGGGFLSGCSGPRQNIAVRADGMIIPCLQLSHMTLGRINHESLVDIWQNHRNLKILRERSRIPLEQFSFCQDCPYIPYCTGNCPATAYTIAGEVNHPGPDACLRLFLQQGGHLPERPVPSPPV
jgi:SynChlorMet cassette radical SAM/SPASM protein ScmE